MLIEIRQSICKNMFFVNGKTVRIEEGKLKSYSDLISTEKDFLIKHLRSIRK